MGPLSVIFARVHATITRWWHAHVVADDEQSALLDKWELEAEGRIPRDVPCPECGITGDHNKWCPRVDE